MRLDKWLKVSRLIKRRTVAQEACDGGRVSVNGVVAKPSREVKVGDVITVSFGSRSLKAEILSVQETVRKDDAAAMYREIGEHSDIYPAESKPLVNQWFAQPLRRVSTC